MSELDNETDSKIKSWLAQEYEEEYSHEYIVQLLFYHVLEFLETNRFMLRYDEHVFYDQFVQFLYKYSTHKSYKAFY